MLAVHCQSATGAGHRQLDSVTSTFLQHLPGLSYPCVIGPVRTEASAGQRFTLARTPATMCNTDPGAPAWPTHRARGAKCSTSIGPSWTRTLLASQSLTRPGTATHQRLPGANHVSSPGAQLRLGSPQETSVSSRCRPQRHRVFKFDQPRPCSRRVKTLHGPQQKGSYAKVRMY